MKKLYIIPHLNVVNMGPDGLIALSYTNAPADNTNVEEGREDGGMNLVNQNKNLWDEEW